MRAKRGRPVRRRPVRSPVFQKRKARGMKQAGWRRREVVEGEVVEMGVGVGVWVERMDWV